MKFLRTGISLNSIINPIVFIILLMGLSIVLQSCSDRCSQTYTYSYYEPVYQSFDEIRSSVKVSEVREISNPGKIYYIKGHILINQPGEGFHVIDNRDVSNPHKIAFVEIPGNYNFAGLGNVLYADSFIDLVVLDLSNMQNIREVNRLEEAFPNISSNGFTVFNEELGVLVDWVEVEEVTKDYVDCDSGYPGRIIPYRGGVLFSNEATMDMASAPGNNPGIGGSLAMFTISGKNLYTIDQNYIKSIDISDNLNPMLNVKLNLGWGLETIFPYGDNIFVGSNAGMHILDVSDHTNPVHVSTFEHVLSCDPVVVQGDYAYVTLRSGTTCRNGENRLDVIDISNKANPTLMSTYSMYNPGGLGIDNNTLFVCDGEAGLKIFDASDKDSITKNFITRYPNLKAIDVIPFNNVLMVIAEDGFYQYDYSDITDISLLSSIEIVDNEVY